jgi:acyl carrier protein
LTGTSLNTQHEVLALLDEILSLNGRAASFTTNTALLGAIPELDSMVVVALITGMEERFGVTVYDDEIDGTIFATVGSLVEFVDAKRAD